VSVKVRVTTLGERHANGRQEGQFSRLKDIGQKAHSSMQRKWRGKELLANFFTLGIGSERVVLSCSVGMGSMIRILENSCTSIEGQLGYSRGLLCLQCTRHVNNMPRQCMRGREAPVGGRLLDASAYGKEIQLPIPGELQVPKPCHAATRSSTYAARGGSNKHDRDTYPSFVPGNTPDHDRVREERYLGPSTLSCV
jgi:hypothetical protein